MSEDPSPYSGCIENLVIYYGLLGAVRSQIKRLLEALEHFVKEKNSRCSYNTGLAQYRRASKVRPMGPTWLGPIPRGRRPKPSRPIPSPERGTTLRLSLKLDFEECNFIHESRSRNHEADSLAKYSLYLDNGRHLWLLMPHDSVIIPPELVDQ